MRRLLTAALCALGAFQQVPVFKTGVDIVNVTAVVTDNKGNLATNLQRDDFELFENGRKQAITYFARGDDDASMQPELHLGLLLDVSESMGEDLGFIKTAAIKFMNRLTPKYERPVTARTNSSARSNGFARRKLPASRRFTTPSRCISMAPGRRTAEK